MLINNITIGHSLKALEWAEQNNTHFIFNRVHYPDFWEDEILKNVFASLYVKMSLSGKIIGSRPVKSIKLELEENKITLVNDSNLIDFYCFERLNIFDTENVIGLPLPVVNVDEYDVYDIVKYQNTPLKKDVYPLRVALDEEPAKNLLFFKNGYITCCVTHSVLNEEQLNEFGYSSTASSFKVREYLKEEYGASSTTNTIKRTVRKRMNIYEDLENVRFIQEK